MKVRGRQTVQRLGVQCAKLYVRRTFQTGCFLSHLEHRCRTIYAEDVPAGRHPVSGEDCRLAPTRRKIQDGHPWAQPCEVDHPLAERPGQPCFGAIVFAPDFFNGKDTSGDHRMVRTTLTRRCAAFDRQTRRRAPPPLRARLVRSRPTRRSWAFVFPDTRFELRPRSGSQFVLVRGEPPRARFSL